jgi:hypothetical protein
MGIRMNTGVKVMDLGSEIYEVILTSIEVKSDQRKGTPVDGSIDPHIYAVHEAHVGVEEERLLRTVGICPGSGSLNVGHGHVAVEVTDRRGINSGTEE